jgi:hypothetical protein
VKPGRKNVFGLPDQLGIQRSIVFEIEMAIDCCDQEGITATDIAFENQGER